jgi:hypothetical protein
MSSTSDSARYDATFMRWVRQTRHFNHSPSKTREASIKLRNFRPHLRNTVEYGVSTHIWANVSRMRISSRLLLISCRHWPKCEYSHHTQLCSLSGGLKLSSCEFDRHIGRLLWILWILCSPNEDFARKEKQKMKSGFSHHFSRAWVLDLGYESLKTQSNFPPFIFCSSFPNLRLGGVNWIHFLLNHFSVYWKVAWLLSTHVCNFLR